MDILVIDDDEEMRRHVVTSLGAGGHEVSQAADAAAALALAGTKHFDAIVLDRLLPDGDGIDIVRELRRSANSTPVLMLTAVGDIDARVAGIEAGADDYLVKPFAFVELRARLLAICRRGARADSPAAVLQVADLTLDAVNRTVRRAGVSIALQPREFMLLEYLMRHCDELVTRTMLLQNVWKYHFDPQTSIVETHISRLRAKVDRGFASGELIETVRGEGYLLRSVASSRAS
ncbi:MAG TPA: response regulator transcription factor [Steroidobacteraceae bacterium]|nr:response regulator transcription factor [Steroidobacteraceae bacterium]